MVESAYIRPGLEALDPVWLAGRRTGLVAHPASRVSDGRHAAEFLRDSGANLVALFGPEHGFFGRGGAGEKIADAAHADWKIPIFSLYGETRAPTPAMLNLVDVFVFDVQTIACRAYTYVSTLRLLMEACAARGKTLVVADRPDPLMLTPPDGPLLDPACASFVGLVPTPFCTGMTPGETALFLKSALQLDALDLRVAPCPGLSRSRSLAQIYPAWHATSPAIVSLENALCFPLTVFFEALPMIDHARGTPLAFQRIGSAHVDLSTLELPPLPGLRVAPCDYPDKHGQRLRGLAFDVFDPAAYRPAAAAFTLISTLEKHLGPALWDFPGTRPDFYAQLWGTRTPAPPWPRFEIQQKLY
ncbi:MAG: exo-beta-N-acetylmuramidase NamZ domain-containing protein [Kiritimatiellia bacterium]